MWLKILFLLAHYIFCSQYKFISANPIVGTNVVRVNVGQFPFVVSMKLINPENPEPETDHGCTGSLISRRHVLSSAHQLEQIIASRIEVVVGSIDMRSGLKFNVLRVITHNQWASRNKIKSRFKSNDIAIAELTADVPDNIRLATLSPLSVDNLYGLDVIVVGWGMTAENKIPRFVNTALLRILTRTECQNRIFSIIQERTNIHERFLCSGTDPYVFLRMGDSGGPLLTYSGEIVGINKASCPLPDDNYNPGKVNLHVAIDYYREFLRNVTGCS